MAGMLVFILPIEFDLIENFYDLDKGLGKDNQGMKTALKPVLKFDTRGVKFNFSNFFYFHYLILGRLQSKR